MILDRLLGFYNSSDSRFTELMGYLDEKSENARRSHYPGIAEHLKRLMVSDSEKFLRETCATNAGPSTYAGFGVLSVIPAAEFAAIFCSVPYSARKDIAQALSIRYEFSRNYNEIQAELIWLGDVYREISMIIASYAPIQRYHLSNFLEVYIAKHLPS